jgi:hypothetical protein
MPTLHDDGYEIRDRWFHIEHGLKELVTERLKTSGGPIFNDNQDIHKNDKKRIQALLPLRDFSVSYIRNKLTWAFPDHAVGGVVALQSKAGCQRQAAHCDYVPDEDFLATTDDTVPLLCVIALEEETKLDVWPRSHQIVRNIRAARRIPTISRKTLILNMGDVVIFRGDLVHAGSSYAATNTRIHVYLDHPTVPRMRNRTWVIYKHADPFLQERIADA